MNASKNPIHSLKCRLEILLSFMSSDHPQAGEILEDDAHNGMVVDKYDSVPWKLGDIGATLKQMYPDATSMLRANHRYAEYTLGVCEFQGSWFVLRKSHRDTTIMTLSPEERIREYEQSLIIATPVSVPFLSERADAMTALREYEERNK